LIDHLWLSPHLDDAVLSSGGAIAAARARGETVRVLTLCTRPPALTSPFIEALHTAWALAASDVIPVRTEEDQRALAILGVRDVVYGDLEDAVYRRPLDYATMETLLGGSIADGDDVVEAFERVIAPHVADAHNVYAPLAVGGHVDHRAVRTTAERTARRLFLYEDVPYVISSGVSGEGAGHEIEITAQIEAKIAAIACYATQLRALFGSAAAMPQAIRDYHRRGDRFVERIWTALR